MLLAQYYYPRQWMQAPHERYSATGSDVGHTDDAVELVPFEVERYPRYGRRPLFTRAKGSKVLSCFGDDIHEQFKHNLATEPASDTNVHPHSWVARVSMIRCHLRSVLVNDIACSADRCQVASKLGTIKLSFVCVWDEPSIVFRDCLP